MVKMEIKWSKNPIKLIESFEKKFPQVIDTVVRDTTAETLKNIMKDTPVKTGNLRRNWFIRKVKDSVYFIINKVKYAPHVEYGTKKHDIYGNPFLHWKSKEFGWIKKRKVTVSGIRAVKMMRNQIEPTKTLLMNKMKEAIRTLWIASKHVR